MYDNDILETLSKLMKLVEFSLEDSREKSLVITKLEEADLWLYKYDLIHSGTAKGSGAIKKGETMGDKDILETLSKLMKLVEFSLEDSREKSLVITKLEEADLWLYKYDLIHGPVYRQRMED